MKTVQNSMNGSLNQNQVDTDTSTNKSENVEGKSAPIIKKLKKRIGAYSFYLTDMIGEGNSSYVYRGIKDNDKSQVVAIKVINTDKMNSHRKHLLQNQANILKMLDHPNIVKLLDIFYTTHNCYIITQFCEKGSLQAVIDDKQDFLWNRAAFQIGKACQYLTSKFILHRDIKPANIFIHNGVFKLGDFGFSCVLNSEDHIIRQEYLIGSPLYMPPEAHKKNHYSLKGDAFAFGVLIYYLSTKHYPWKGKDKFDLIKHYEKNLANQKYIENFPPKLKHYINGLLKLNEYQRFSISSIDLQIFNHVRISNGIERQLKTISKSYDLQIKICQYANLLKVNFLKYETINPFLYHFLTDHLAHLISVFEWGKQSALKELSKNYKLPENASKFHSDDYFWMNNCLKDTIKTLSESKDNSTMLGLLQKLVYYERIIQCLQFESQSALVQQISKLTLHYSFELVKPNGHQLQQMIREIDFYQL